MTPEQFTYWLQGFIEIGVRGSIGGLNDEQWKIIQDHLKTVFIKVTPDRELGDISKKQFNPNLGGAVPNYPHNAQTVIC